MRAITYSQYGEPETLQLTEDAPQPKLGPGSVLIRVERAAVNPVDWKVMAGYLDPCWTSSSPPFPAGMWPG